MKEKPFLVKYLILYFHPGIEHHPEKGATDLVCLQP
jgi:hypothetical protein